MEKIDKIIQIIRENMVANSPGQGGGFSSNSPSEGPTSGYDQPINFKKRKNGNIDGRSVSQKYKKWLKSMGML